MSYHAYDLDSSDSSDSILQMPQKKSKKSNQGYSNDSTRKNSSKPYEYSEEYENNQPLGSTRKSKAKKSTINEKSKRKNYDIQDSDDENDDDDNAENESINRKHPKNEKKSSTKKKYNSDYDDNDDSYNSQRNLTHNNKSNESKSRAYSYGKTHKNDTKFLNFDSSDNEEDHEIEYSTKNKKQKPPVSDTNSRSNAKYSNTIGGGENSLNYRSQDFNPQTKNKTKNVIRTNDFTSKKNQKRAYSNVQYQNYDSEDNSSDDPDYNDDKQQAGNKAKKRNSEKMTSLIESNNNNSIKKAKDQTKDSSSYSVNENCDWSFPMNYVPDPDDMKQIIEDYHDKYSVDFLLKRIMNNPSYRSSNDE